MFLAGGKSFFDWIRVILSEYGLVFLRGIGVTLLLALVGTIVGLLLALVFSIIQVQSVNKRDSRVKKLLVKTGKFFVKSYVTIIRGTPMMVQAMIFFYGFSAIGIKWSPLVAGLFTVSINTTAYLTEVLRGGIEAVDIGQMEASRCLGMSRIKALIYVIYPQAIKNSMASIGNEFIINIKDTSVLGVIGLYELFKYAEKAGNRYVQIIPAMVIAACIYLVLTYTSAFILKKIERKIGAPVKEIVSSN